MVKGKPKKKHPQSQAKGNSKPGDRRPKDDETSIQVLTDDRNKVDVAGKEVNEVADEMQVGTIESKKYGRRKIESNWSRYNEVEVDELLEVKEDYDETKDFDYIRQNSASSSSLFKFKEEKEWENELETNKDNNVFALDLVELATSLQKYGVGEKLGLLDLIEEECKYCITDIIECTTKPEESSSCPQGVIKCSKKMTWSYDGMDKYKQLIGLAPENEQLQTYEKVNKKSSPGNIETEVEHEDKSDTIVKHLANKNVPEKSKDLHLSLDRRSDCDILDELLIDNISFNDSNKWLDECSNNENENELIKKDNRNDNEIQNESPCKVSNMENEESPIFQSNGTAFRNKISEDELDLDMLLECDLLPSDSDIKDGEVDGDLDQWLDDMLI